MEILQLPTVLPLLFTIRCLAMTAVLLRIYEAVAYQWSMSRCLFRGRCLATGLYATMFVSL
jgi:hypothetical protein